MSLVKELKMKAYKIRREKRKQKYSKYHGSLIVSLIISIIGPWFLTFMFLNFLEIWSNLINGVKNDPNILFTMLIFYSFNLTYEMPILGNGFWLVFIIWAFPGLLIGLITRNAKKSSLIAFVGLTTTYVLYIILINYRMFGSYLPRELIDSLISSNLYSNFGFQTLYYLFLQITIQSFALPLMITFGIFGSLVNPKLQIT